LEGQQKYDTFIFDDVPKYRLLLAAIPMNIPTSSENVPAYHVPLAECKTKCPVDFANSGIGDEDECIESSLKD